MVPAMVTACSKSFSTDRVDNEHEIEEIVGHSGGDPPKHTNYDREIHFELVSRGGRMIPSEHLARRNVWLPAFVCVLRRLWYVLQEFVGVSPGHFAVHQGDKCCVVCLSCSQLTAPMWTEPMTHASVHQESRIGSPSCAQHGRDSMSGLPGELSNQVCVRVKVCPKCVQFGPENARVVSKLGPNMSQNVRLEFSGCPEGSQGVRGFLRVFEGFSGCFWWRRFSGCLGGFQVFGRCSGRVLRCLVGSQGIWEGGKRRERGRSGLSR